MRSASLSWQSLPGHRELLPPDIATQKKRGTADSLDVLGDTVGHRGGDIGSDTIDTHGRCPGGDAT